MKTKNEAKKTQHYGSWFPKYKRQRKTAATALFRHQKIKIGRLKTKSLREQTSKMPGGQKGREGNTLKKSENPDQVTFCVPDYRTACGSDLQDVPFEFIEKRQVIDI